MLEELEPKIGALHLEPKYAKFAVEPLERGFGHTLGNAFRRVMLAHLPGAAITHVRLEGVVQEFTSLPGVMEDSTEILLNLKELALRVDPEVPPDRELVLRLEATGATEVTGADLQCPPEVEVANPEHHIARLTDAQARLSLEIWVRRGVGFLPIEERDRGQLGLDLIPVDAVFSPVPRVAYSVESTRKGGRTDLDRLILEVWTNGTVEPQEAVRDAAMVLHEYLNIFGEIPRRAEASGEEIAAGEELGSDSDQRPIEEMDFSVRTFNCLKKEGLNTLGALQQRTAEDLLEIRNFGKRSLDEVIEKLVALGLELTGGMPSGS